VVEGVSQRKKAGLSSVLQSRYRVDAMVSTTVSLAELVEGVSQRKRAGLSSVL
jgi:hypothetical protein